MKVGILCEFSGTVRDAFIRRGHNAISCDLLPSEASGPHIQGDCLSQDWSGRDVLICHPPCTRLCNSGVRWLRERNLWKEMEEAAAFFKACLGLADRFGCKLAAENPVPHRHAKLPPYTQIVQPWQFGQGFTKKTCLWLVGLPKLKPTNIVPGRVGKCHGESPGPDRWKRRSLTYPGIADAMAEQWGSIPLDSEPDFLYTDASQTRARTA